MKKQPDSTSSQDATFTGATSLIEDALALQESDVYNPFIHQYVQSITKKTASGTPDVNIKSFISKSIWPRLVLMRIRAVFVTLIPLIHLTNQDDILDGLSHVQLFLSILGWVLHALRLLINLLSLLMSCLLGDLFSWSDKKSAWQTCLKIELTESWKELGNDLLWVMTTLTSSIHIALSVTLMLVDIAWVVYCGYAELARLNQFKKGFEQRRYSGSISQEKLTDLESCQDNLQKRLAYTQKKLIVSLLTTISTTTLAFLRTALMPSIATNPILLLGFALLSLVITLASHFIGEWLKRERPPEKIAALEKNYSLTMASRITFFKPASDNVSGFSQYDSLPLIKC